MIIVILVLYGLCLGSFVNALVWRVHEQTKGKKTKVTDVTRLSIAKGRSMCPNCGHELSTADLVPVFSWLWLRGKCRYCNKPISVQYPAVELLTAALFVASYIWWPVALGGVQTVIFGLWLLLLVGLMALLVYDFRWMLLPNRLMYPLGGLAAMQAALVIGTSNRPMQALINTGVAVVIGGGLFYVLFQVSNGKWIGGGDVKLGWLLGLVVGTPAGSVLFIFLAALGGSIVSLPLLASKKLKRGAVIPFGPFLIIGAIIVQLFGADLISWYAHDLLGL